MANTKDKSRKTILDTRVKLLSFSVSMNLITPFMDFTIFYEPSGKRTMPRLPAAIMGET